MAVHNYYDLDVMWGKQRITTIRIPEKQTTTFEQWITEYICEDAKLYYNELDLCIYCSGKGFSWERNNPHDSQHKETCRYCDGSKKGDKHINKAFYENWLSKEGLKRKEKINYANTLCNLISDLRFQCRTELMLEMFQIRKDDISNIRIYPIKKIDLQTHAVVYNEHRNYIKLVESRKKSKQIKS